MTAADWASEADFDWVEEWDYSAGIALGDGTVVQVASSVKVTSVVTVVLLAIEPANFQVLLPVWSYRAFVVCSTDVSTCTLAVLPNVAFAGAERFPAASV